MYGIKAVLPTQAFRNLEFQTKEKKNFNDFHTFFTHVSDKGSSSITILSSLEMCTPLLEAFQNFSCYFYCSYITFVTIKYCRISTFKLSN